MKAALISFALAALITSAAGTAGADVRFAIENADEGEGQWSRVLVATAEGRRYRITHPAWEDLVLREVLETGDFDGDGLPDALIAMDTGGNCCPQDFAVVSYRGNGFFTTLGPPESMGWGGIDVDMDEGGLLIRSHHSSAGYGNTEDREWQIDYRIRNGLVTEVARRENRAELAADPVLTIDDVNEANEASIAFDLNADGSPDAITCRFWDRWGLLNCAITAAELGPVGTLACPRIGVLPTMQNGWHDLSCGRRGVAAWSEGEYRLP